MTKSRPFVSITRKIPCRFDALSVYRAWRGRGPSVLLESARTSADSRHSIIAADPYRVIRQDGVSGDPFSALRAELKSRPTPSVPGLPPFLGGAVGFAGYEARNILEPKLSRRTADDIGLPAVCFFLFDHGVVLDHAASEALLFCHVPDARAGRAEGQRRLDALARRLNRRLAGLPRLFNRAPAAGKMDAEFSLSREAFVEKVKAAQRHIRAGDIFQANLSQRISFPLREDALAVYARLRRINPSAFFGFFDAGDFQIVCGSPERLVKLESGVLETRPIAGTRWRGRDEREDRALSLELLLSPKERAEHVMLVDLERNDLGRVCEYGSVKVDRLMAVEDYSHVKHIVSVVSGRLRPELDALDALCALFPGGTITGAPKFRCMEIIDALEPVARGPYTGSLGYLGFSGDMDFNIIIRSLVVKAGRAHLQVGAGIVADSAPEKEYDETLHKAEAVLTAVFGAAGAKRFLRRCRGTAALASR